MNASRKPRISRTAVRKLLCILPMLMAVPVFGTVAAEDGADSPPPNFVVILVDDLRWDEIGCAGHPFVRTPHIDRIACEGVRFRNAFCTTPLCSPVRASLLTGLYTHRHGIKDNTDRSADSHLLPTFPRTLQKAGYETAFIGKWHMGNDDTPRPGFDQWVCLRGQGTSFDPVLNVNGTRISTTGHTTDVLNEYAVAFANRARTRPFCLYLSHKALHPELMQRDDGSLTDPAAARFLPAPRHDGLYRDDAIPRRLNVLDDLAGKPALARPIADLPPLSAETWTTDETVRDRLRMLAGIDEGVGQLIQALEESGALEATVLIFTSDHGYWYGEHGLSVERRLAYEEGIRIPLLIRYPPLVPAGSIVDAFALSIDLAPTLLELARVDPKQDLDGRSLVPLFGGEVPEDWPTSFLIEYYSDTVFPRVHSMGYQAIRTSRWKYIRYHELEGMDELYDLLHDPYEMRNRAGDADAREIRKHLEQELERLVNPLN